MEKQRKWDLSLQEQKEAEMISLLRQAGFSRRHFDAFDEYALFDQNRAFLKKDHMLTFTDAHGKLHALRPDVTLSVMKQTAYRPADLYRIYYQENVFRFSNKTHQYGLHRQIGAEEISPEGMSDGFEVLELARHILALLGSSSVLVLSHMGFLLSNQWYLDQAEAKQEQIISYIAQKNPHDLKKYLTQLRCPEAVSRGLLAATRLSGKPDTVLEEIRSEHWGKELEQAAEEVCALVQRFPAATAIEEKMPTVLLDFSLVNPLSYYNGIIFQGFVKPCSQYVLSGGRYDKLAMRFMSWPCRAIGFAVELNVLEELWQQERT